METGQGAAAQWTAERVGDALVEAFRALPHMPVYAPRPSRLEAALPGHDPTPLDVLALTEQVLGRSSPQHRLVLVWARSIATGGDIGGSLREWCRAHGISRSTFDRQRMRACANIAVSINRLGNDGLVAADTSPRDTSGLVRACWKSLSTQPQANHNFSTQILIS